MIQVAYAITASEYGEMARVAARSTPREGPAAIWLVSFAVGAIGIALAFASGRNGHWFAPALLAGYAFYVLVHLLHRGHADVDAKWKQWEDAFVGATLEVYGDRLALITSRGEHSYPWTAFTKVTETARLFILTLGSGPGGVAIPKRLFNDEQLAAFRAISRQSLRGQSMGFPVLPVNSPRGDAT